MTRIQLYVIMTRYFSILKKEEIPKQQKDLIYIRYTPKQGKISSNLSPCLGQ